MTRAEGGSLVAAGLLKASGLQDPSLTRQEVTTRLTELLDSSTLWQRVDDRRGRPASVDMLTPGPAAEWSPPEPMDPAFEAAVGDAWGRVIATWDRAANARGNHRPPVVRVTVRSADDAEALAEARGSGATIVPMVAHRALRFAWRWPMRVGVLEGPRAAEWRDRMMESSHAGTLYEVRLVPAGDEQDLEILIVDANLDRSAAHAALRPAQAACVIVVGEGIPAWELCERAATELHPAVAAGVEAAGVDWFRDFVHELAHDQPVDTALALTTADVRLAGDPELVNLTAVGRWAAAAADIADSELADHLRSVVAHGDFTFESYAATDITLATGSLVGTPGEVVVEHRFPMATAAPPEPTEPATATAPAARRLLADITREGLPCRRALVPEADHQLEVVIAMPEEPGEGLPFDENAVPTGEGVARLQVDVTCDDLGLRAIHSIDLPTADRSRPSTVAMFPFRTGAEGSVLQFEIIVLHKGRPIQEARMLATVRSTPARRDRVQLLSVPLSSRPEPAVDATPAELSLDAREGRLVPIGENAELESVDLTQLRDLLDTIELRASKVLAGEDRVSWQVGQQAPPLLIDLARKGSLLHRKLAVLDVPSARTVSVLVRYDTPIIPVELAYAGPAPTQKAKLCRHAARPPAVATAGCSKASTSVVCPYAFWGMHRTIARTIKRRPRRRAVPPELGPLRLRPVLFAAANLADNDLPPGTPEEDRPSQVLQAALAEALGTSVARVTNWRTWRRQVRSTRPELLVVLGHTEVVNGETTLLIGRRSVLAQPDITASFVAPDGGLPPLVVLLSCRSGIAGDAFFGALPASFTDSGAAAVVATLSKLTGPDGARAAAAVVTALRASGSAEGTTLGAALTAARRSLITAGMLVGLVLVAHGEIDVKLVRD